MYRSCCHHTLRKCPHGLAQHTQTHHNTLQHTSRHSTAQHSNTQRSPARSTRHDPIHICVQRTVAPPAICNTAQRSTAPPTCAPAAPCASRVQEPAAVSFQPTRTTTMLVRAPTRSAGLPSSPGMGEGRPRRMRGHMDASHAASQPVSGKARTCRRGKTSGLVTRSLWLLWLLWAPLALVLAAIPPLCDCHVHPPTQRTASAGSTTDRRQQTMIRKCTSLPRPALWRIYPPRLPGRCQPALTLRAHAHMLQTTSIPDTRAMM